MNLIYYICIIYWFSVKLQGIFLGFRTLFKMISLSYVAKISIISFVYFLSYNPFDYYWNSSVAASARGYNTFLASRNWLLRLTADLYFDTARCGRNCEFVYYIYLFIFIDLLSKYYRDYTEK